MKYTHYRAKPKRWLCLLLFALIPLFLSPRAFEHLEVANLVRTRDICNSITFHYGDHRTITTYNDSPTGIRYVLLPSFANMQDIGVEVKTDQVVFTTSREEFTIRKNEYSACSFEPEIEYHVSFQNQSGKELATDTIVFLKSDKLPTLYVTTETGTMEKLDADKTYSEGGFYELIQVDGSVLSADSLTSISARGNQTFLYEKKSYQIDLKHPVDLLDMGESDTWILLSNVYDPSYIRNKLTYDMALQAGMEGSPHSEYIDVYFNGNYAGMYLLTEKVEFAENRLEYADLESANLAVNKGGLGKMPIYSLEGDTIKALYIPNNPIDITGGYLIEHDYGYKFEAVKSGFTTKLGEQFVLKNPEHASVKEIQYIHSLMQEIEDAIMSPDGINPNTGKHYTEYIDIDSWADKYLVEEICRNNGGGTTSSYFYKPSDSINTKVFGGPVWDYDKAYGNYHNYNKNTRDLAFMTLHEHYSNWFYYLYQHEEFVTQVKTNYNKKFSKYLEEMATNKIDEYSSQIFASAKLDNARFSHLYAENEQEYIVLAEYIRHYILNRKDFLDEVWIDDVPITLIHFKYEWENGNRTIGVINGENIQEFPNIYVEGQELSHWKVEGTNIPYTKDTPVTEEITLVPVWK